VDPEVPFVLRAFAESAERTRKSPCLGAKLSAPSKRNQNISIG